MQSIYPLVVVLVDIVVMFHDMGNHVYLTKEKD